MDKDNAVHIYSGILLGHKKKNEILPFVILLGHKKKNEILPFVTTWTDFKGIC